MEAGLTLPENEFKTKVPAATNFDQNIANALKAIDTWNASERNQLFQWLKGLGFDL